MRRDGKLRPFIESRFDVGSKTQMRIFKSMVFAEVFIRKNMGYRYFTWKVFRSSILLLLIIRAIPVVTHPKFNPNLRSFPIDWMWFDIFIVGYVFLSLIHLYRQYQRWAGNNRTHSFHIGEPRLLPLGKMFSPIQDYQYVTYQYVEPLLVFLLSFLSLFFLHWFWSLIIFSMAVSMYRHAKKIFNEEDDLRTIIEDGDFESKRTHEAMNEKDQIHFPNKIKKTNSKAKPLKKQRTKSPHSSLSLEEIRRRLNKK